MRSARIDYCTKKYKFFDNRAADLNAQATKLQEDIRQMDLEIQAIRNNWGQEVSLLARLSPWERKGFSCGDEPFGSCRVDAGWLPVPTFP
jgi:hypothetical protein